MLILTLVLDLVSSLRCGDFDTRCIEHGCSLFCSQWTCDHPDCPGCGPEVGCPNHPPPPPPPPPLPLAPPWDAAGAVLGELHIVAVGSKLYANGEPLHVRCATNARTALSAPETLTSYALELVCLCRSRVSTGLARKGALVRPWVSTGTTSSGAPQVHGEPSSPPQSFAERGATCRYMSFLRQHRFNAVRLLFNHETILKDRTLDPPNTAVYGDEAPWEAPELANFKYLEMFKRIAEVAGEHGIIIMIACHRLKPAAWPGDGKWFDETITEDKVKDSWGNVARKLCNQWNVVAADLQNEPHGSSWAKGMGDQSDWGHAAERIGNHVLSVCPRWMVMVEGVGYDPGAKDMDNGGAGIWWGENLAGAMPQPVVLSNPAKLAYSPHTYGPSVYMQKYFQANNFPSNMAQIWMDRFAFLSVQGIAPVVIGEMGGFYDAPGNPSGHDPNGLDKVWQDWAIAFCRNHSIGMFYFALNPGSDDTGGLLKDDWTTPVDSKLKLLSGLPSTDILSARARSFPASPPAPNPARPPSPPAPPPPPAPRPLPPPPLQPPISHAAEEVAQGSAMRNRGRTTAVPRHMPSTQRFLFFGLLAGGVVACCLMASAGAVLLIRGRYSRGEILPSDEEKATKARRSSHSKRIHSANDSDDEDYSDDEDDEDGDGEEESHNVAGEENHGENGKQGSIAESASEASLAKANAAMEDAPSSDADVPILAPSDVTASLKEQPAKAAVPAVPVLSSATASLSFRKEGAAPVGVADPEPEAQMSALLDTQVEAEHPILAPGAPRTGGVSSCGAATLDDEMDVFERQGHTAEKRPGHLEWAAARLEERAKPARPPPVTQAVHGFDLD